MSAIHGHCEQHCEPGCKDDGWYIASLDNSFHRGEYTVADDGEQTYAAVWLPDRCPYCEGAKAERQRIVEWLHEECFPITAEAIESIACGAHMERP